MPTIDDLRRTLASLAEDPAARSDAELLAAARERVADEHLGDPRGGRRRRTEVVLAAAAVLALVAGAAWWSKTNPNDDQVITGNDPAPAPGSESDPQWEVLARHPNPVLSEAVLIPGGVFAWQAPGGGPAPPGEFDPTQIRPDLLAGVYDDQSRSWTVLNSEGRDPLPEGGASETVWTGEVVVHVAAGNDDGAGVLQVAQWRPGDDVVTAGATTSVPGGPQDVWLGVRLTTDGDDVLALVSVPVPFADGSSYLVDNHLLRYRPDADDWTVEEDPPQTSDRIYGFEQTPAGLLITSAVPPAQGAQLNRYGGVVVDREVQPGVWDRSTPGPDELTGQSAGAAWADDRLVVVSYRPSAATWDPDRDAWTVIDAPPIDGCEDYPAALRAADRVITGYCSRFAALRDGDDRWEPLPADDVAVLVDSDGDRVLAYRLPLDQSPGLAVLRWE
jgi:hypothetical protein